MITSRAGSGALLIVAVLLIAGINYQNNLMYVFAFWLLTLLAFAIGVLIIIPIGGADMPVVISLYNALTGLAVAFEGFVLNNAAMIIAGTMKTLLTTWISPSSSFKIVRPSLP